MWFISRRPSGKNTHRYTSFLTGQIVRSRAARCSKITISVSHQALPNLITAFPWNFTQRVTQKPTPSRGKSRVPFHNPSRDISSALSRDLSRRTSNTISRDIYTTKSTQELSFWPHGNLMVIPITMSLQGWPALSFVTISIPGQNTEKDGCFRGFSDRTNCPA